LAAIRSTTTLGGSLFLRHICGSKVCTTLLLANHRRPSRERVACGCKGVIPGWAPQYTSSDSTLTCSDGVSCQRASWDAPTEKSPHRAYSQSAPASSFTAAYNSLQGNPFLVVIATALLSFHQMSLSSATAHNPPPDSGSNCRMLVLLTRGNVSE